MKKLIDRVIMQQTFAIRSQGISMLPILQPKDLVYYRRITFAKSNVNDLLLVSKNKKIFTHRVIYKTNKYLITKGDNNHESDGKIYPKHIVAKVIRVKRKEILFNPGNLYLLQSTHYFTEIVKLKKQFQAELIDFVFLKGLPLYLFFEKTHPRRLYADCDVLIKPKDKKIAEHILNRQGYKRVNSGFSKIQSILQDREIETSFYKIMNGFSVMFDVHYEASFLIVHLGKLNHLYHEQNIHVITKLFLQNKQQILIQNESFPVLNKQHFTIYLALHFFHHNFSGAFRLDFLNKVIRKAKFEVTAWNRIAKTITQFHLQNFVYPVFLLLKKYYKTPIPVVFFQSIKPNSPSALGRVNSLIKTNVFDDESRVGAGIRRFKNLFWLSPEPLWRRIFVFASPQIFYTIFWLLKKRLFSFFSAARQVL